MKLLRVGIKGKEKPAVLDKDGKIRDISSHIIDLEPENLNFEKGNLWSVRGSVVQMGSCSLTSFYRHPWV